MNRIPGISPEFLKSFIKLDKKSQKYVIDKYINFDDVIKRKGCRFHRLDRIANNDLWSISINMDLRVIVYKEDDEYTFVYAAHHDEAYDWAKNKSRKWHYTGRADLNKEINLENIEELTFDHVKENKYEDIGNKSLFEKKGVSIKDIEKIGLENRQAKEIYKIKDEVEFIKCASQFDREIEEALCDLADGISVEQIIENRQNIRYYDAEAENENSKQQSSQNNKQEKSEINKKKLIKDEDLEAWKLFLQMRKAFLQQNNKSQIKGVDVKKNIIEKAEMNNEVDKIILSDRDHYEDKHISKIELCKFPLDGVKNYIPKSKIAKPLTSKEIVSDTEKDSFYFREIERRGIYLNEKQIEAVRHFEGSELILAGAGSGKTSVLVTRTGYLINYHKVHPRNILLITFTKKAANEIRDRIVKLPGIPASILKEINIGTFHSIFLKILRKKGYKQNILFDEGHKKSIISVILRKMRLHNNYNSETLLADFSRYKNRLIECSKLPENTLEEKEFKAIFKNYEAYKAEHNYMDFDDIILKTFFVLKENTALLKSLQNYFQFIMVDEFQDTNFAQYEIIRMLAQPQNNLCVVGDDDQSIYKFRGADSRYILEFSKLYPKTKIITLDINYRSSNYIVGLGNEIIKNNDVRYEKELKAVKSCDYSPFYYECPTSLEEASYIVQMIKNEVETGNRSYKDFCILHRSSVYARSMFEQLMLNDIPLISYSDVDYFYQDPIIKPVIDHLRLSINENDTNAIPDILPSLYLNKKKVMMKLLPLYYSDPSKTAISYLPLTPDMNELQMQQVFERVQLIKTLKEKKPGLAIREIRPIYEKYLFKERLKDTMYKEIVEERLNELEVSSERFDSIAEFISFVDEIIDMNDKVQKLKKDEQADAVSLMTIHKSKGLEFPVVCVIGVLENVIPHKFALQADEMEDTYFDNKSGIEKIKEAVEEERRLMYVAVTRAKEEIYISFPNSYMNEPAVISRFLLDIFN